MNINASLGTPIQGVSTQPPKVRNEGQCTEQINMIPDPVHGLVSRYGSEFVARIAESLPEGTKYHMYDRGDGERYLMAVLPNNPLPRVWDLNNGTEASITAPDGPFSYLDAATPSEEVELNTVLDTTFITNKTVVPLKIPDPDYAPSLTTLINVQFADYGRTYKVIINGEEAAVYQTPDGSVSSHINQVDTSYVAEQLAGQPGTETIDEQVKTLKHGIRSDYSSYTYLDRRGSSVPISVEREATGEVFTRWWVSGSEIIIDRPPNSGIAVGENFRVFYRDVARSSGLSDLADFEVDLRGNVIILTNTAGQDYTVETVDGASGNDLIAVKEQVNSVGQLPIDAPPGYIVKVLGDGQNAESAYWLEAQPQSESGSRVSWVECASPAVSRGIDPETMPHLLVRTSLSPLEFEVQRAEWGARRAGSDANNPMPSFIQDGSPINALGTVQGRLFMLAGESIVMSVVDNFFDLFRYTVQVTTDDQPVDIYADTNRVNVLVQYAIQDGDLVAFSNNGQFVLPLSQPITSKTASLKPASTYETNVDAPAAASGRSIFFAFDYGISSGISELYSDTYVDKKRAESRTDHVRGYITGSVRHMDTSPNIDTLLVLAGPENVIYTYNWLLSGDQLRQSAWGKWVFPEGTRVLYFQFLRDEVFLVMERPSGVYIESINMGEPLQYGLPFPIRFDNRALARAYYNPSTEKWYVEPSGVFGPLDPLPPLSFVLGQHGWPSEQGAEIDMQFQEDYLGPGQGAWVTSQPLGDPLTLPTDGTGPYVEVVAGLKYLASYEPSEPVVRSQDGRAIGTGRLTLGSMILNYEAIGSVLFRTISRWGEEKTQTFSGRFMGNAANMIGTAGVEEGQVSFGVRQRSDRVRVVIETDSHIPFRLRDIEYKGRYYNKGERI